MKQRGYTLLETLFVIMVLAVLGVAGFEVLTQKKERNAVLLTAMEVQGIQHAALAYYLENNQWPSTIKQLQTSDTAYLLPLAECSLWLGETSFSTSASCPFSILYKIILPDSPELSQYLTVSATVPDKTIAQEVVAELPSAYLATETEVRSLIPIPGYSEPNPDHIIIKRISMDYAGKEGVQIPKPTCPPGWVPEIKAALAMLYNIENNDNASQQIYAVKISGKECPKSESDDDDFEKEAINNIGNGDDKNHWRFYVCTDSESPDARKIVGVDIIPIPDAKNTREGTALTITYCRPNGYREQTAVQGIER